MENQIAKPMLNGKCNICKGVFTKKEMTRHLRSCGKNRDNLKTDTQKLQKTKKLHILVEGKYQSDYWLHLKAFSSATLEDIDAFLRDIWLECCGHLSMFTIEGKTYSSSPMEEYEDRSMNIKLDMVLRPGLKFRHEYDFGSTTHLLLKVISEEESEIKDKPIQILARNESPLISCSNCGKAAVKVCASCSWSGEGWLCKDCANSHKCGEDMLLPVVNSPRVGVCGYTG
ncbi:MAG: hypothetical protein P9M13_08495 [Candidatus Ancaeobacter aquaticus]|nr:hypothetical protein [Candidatus Ancaeobacter aquaticus]